MVGGGYTVTVRNSYSARVPTHAPAALCAGCSSLRRFARFSSFSDGVPAMPVLDGIFRHDYIISR